MQYLGAVSILFQRCREYAPSKNGDRATKEKRKQSENQKITFSDNNGGEEGKGLAKT